MRSRTNLNSKCVGCYANVLHSLYLAAAQLEELHLEGRRRRFQPAGEQSRYEVSARTRTNVRREHTGVPNVLYAACAPEGAVRAPSRGLGSLSERRGASGAAGMIMRFTKPRTNK